MTASPPNDAPIPPLPRAEALALAAADEQPEELTLDIHAQPTDVTCGPTCLHAVYRFHRDPITLDQVIAETPMLETGGTLAVNLANHALARGYRATIYTFDLHLFDPTWFLRPDVDLAERLARQRALKDDPKLAAATDAFLEFLRLGGRLRFEDLTVALIRRYLRREVPILVGLSSTYLYHSMREVGETNKDDDLRGEPSGHFVVVCGYVPRTREAKIADPLHPNPLVGRKQHYLVPIQRLVGAILLGIVTHDANLLILEPGPARSARRPRASDHAPDLPRRR